MKIDLVPEAAAEVVGAVRAAAASSGLVGGVASATAHSGWATAALAEGVDRDPGYVPVPRSKRGATRA